MNIKNCSLSNEERLGGIRCRSIQCEACKTVKKFDEPVSPHLESYYESRNEEGNYCVIYEQEQWDGFANNLDLLNFMETKGWKFISSCKYVLEGSGRLCDRTSIELIFRRIQK